MTLKELTLWGERDKVAVSIERLRMFEPPEGYYLAFSGGKDSCTIKVLADMAGVKYDAHYNLTTVDPPELVRFIREKHPDVAIDRPECSMWELIVKEQYPPTMIQRYCCKHLKERGGIGRVVLTGIRAEESTKRARRKMVEQCYRVQKSYLHAIIDWTERDVWQFIRENGLPYCSLYDEGFDRIGCIMCPFERRAKKERDIARWPKYYAAYVRAFDKMVDVRKAAGKRCDWATGQDVMNWWLNDVAHVADEQCSFLGIMEGA
jgi:phosphoadenosine phosphosulfate reductase